MGLIEHSLRTSVRCFLKTVMDPRVPLAIQRRWLTWLAKSSPRLRGTSQIANTLAGFPVEIFRNGRPGQAIILYLHGGAYLWAVRRVIAVLPRIWRRSLPLTSSVWIIAWPPSTPIRLPWTMPSPPIAVCWTAAIRPELSFWPAIPPAEPGPGHGAESPPVGPAQSRCAGHPVPVDRSQQQGVASGHRHHAQARFL